MWLAKPSQRTAGTDTQTGHSHGPDTARRGSWPVGRLELVCLKSGYPKIGGKPPFRAMIWQEKKTFWTNLVSENSWRSFVAVPSRLEFPDVKPIVIQWLLLSPYIWWNQLSKILATNMCASFYTISNSECKLSRTAQLGMFFFSEFTTENIAAYNIYIYIPSGYLT